LAIPLANLVDAAVMFHLAGVDKRAFVQGIADDPQTYRNWEGNGAWNIETSGKEDDMFSPFLHKPFAQAVRDGVIPDNLSTLAGTWGAIHDSGELTYMNVIHLPEIDGTDPDSMTRGEIVGRRQAMHAIDALRRYTPGCSTARLRNFGMTIGIRDTRKIDAVYNMTENDVRQQAEFEDTIGIYPEFIDGYGILILPTTGRYFQLPFRNLLPKGIDNLLVAGRSSGGDRVSHAATRNMACCAVLGQGAGIAAAVSLRTERELADVDIAKVQAELERQGVRLR
jgi:hypothetical protein